MSILARQYGDEALILMNEGNPTCAVFENGGPVGDLKALMIEEPKKGYRLDVVEIHQENIRAMIATARALDCMD